jgi:hypothetical protein
MAIDLLKQPLFFVEQSNQELVAENFNLKSSNKMFVTLFVALGLTLATYYVIMIVQESNLKKIKSDESEL